MLLFSCVTWDDPIAVRRIQSFDINAVCFPLSIATCLLKISTQNLFFKISCNCLFVCVLNTGTYANDWCAVQQQLEDEGVNGPIFISIGDEEKLKTFLKQNPNISKDQMFVDDYNFDAYKAVGFKSFLEVDKETVKDVKMSAPQLSFKQWMSYAGNVGKVSPIPKDMKFGDVPEGVLRLGGTFVVNGDDVIYQWSDKIPGDHPDIEEVVSIAQSAQAQSGIRSFFN